MNLGFENHLSGIKRPDTSNSDVWSLDSLIIYARRWLLMKSPILTCVEKPEAYSLVYRTKCTAFSHLRPRHNCHKVLRPVEGSATCGQRPDGPSERAITSLRTTFQFRNAAESAMKPAIRNSCRCTASRRGSWGARGAAVGVAGLHEQETTVLPRLSCCSHWTIWRRRRRCSSVIIWSHYTQTSADGRRSIWKCELRPWGLSQPRRGWGSSTVRVTLLSCRWHLRRRFVDVSRWTYPRNYNKIYYSSVA